MTSHEGGKGWLPPGCQQVVVGLLPVKLGMQTSSYVLIKAEEASTQYKYVDQKPTACMSGPKASALSTQRPVMTMSAPRSRQRQMGGALTEREVFVSKNTRVKERKVFSPQVNVHTVERFR